MRLGVPRLLVLLLLIRQLHLFIVVRGCVWRHVGLGRLDRVPVPFICVLCSHIVFWIVLSMLFPGFFLSFSVGFCSLSQLSTMEFIALLASEQRKQRLFKTNVQKKGEQRV
jgi:hypothetical protein